MAKLSDNTKRVIAVILGCVGAFFLVHQSLMTFFAYVMDFSLSKGIFNYFLGTELMSLATLMIGITFFVSKIEDLAVIRKGVTLFTLVVSLIVLFCYIIIVANSFPPSFTSNFWNNIAMLIFLICYVCYCFYNLGAKKINNFTWVIYVISLIVLLVVYCMKLSTSLISLSAFIYYIIHLLAHSMVFYCGLKKY